MPGKSFQQLQAENPMQPGENAISYSLRLGKISQAQNAQTATDLTPAVKALATVAPFLNPATQALNMAQPGPQGANEPDALAWARQTAGKLLWGNDPGFSQSGPQVVNAIKSIPGAVGSAFSAATDTPAARAVRVQTPTVVPPAAGNVQPKPFIDPVRSFMDSVRGPESGGDYNVRNKMGSSATGAYQFTDKTWKGAYRQTFGKAAAGMTDAQILAQRADPNVQDKVMYNTGKGYVGALSASGLAVNNTNMYMLHFLGPKAVPIMKTLDAGGRDVPISQFASPEEIRLNPWLQNGATVGQVYTRVDRAINGKNTGSGRTGAAGRTMDNIDAAGGLAGGFDPSYGNAAIAEINKGAAAAKQPTDVITPFAPPPTLPDMKTAAPTDFTASDAALKDLAPEVITEKQKQQIRRQDMWKGIGQAIAASPEGVGVGRLLAMVGGGALSGVAAGNDENRARQDKFDEEMARYKVAVFNNDINKARVAHDEAQTTANAANDTAKMRFAQATDIWNKFNGVSVQGNNVVTSSYDPKTGTAKTHIVPIASGIDAAAAAARAQVMGQMGEQANALNGANARIVNSAIVGSAALEAQRDPHSPTAADAIGTGIGFTAYGVVDDGTWTKLFPPEVSTAMQKEALQYATRMGADPASAAGQEMIKKHLAGQIGSAAATDGSFRKQLFGQSGRVVDSFRNDQIRGSTQKTQVGPKGTTTTTTLDASQ